MGERREIFDLSELTHLVYRCRCGLEMTFDVTADLELKDEDCPACGYSSYPLKNVLIAYARVHRMVADSKLAVRISSAARAE